MIAGANLGEESPVAVLEEIDEEEASCGDGLTEGVWLPIGELGHGRVGMLAIDRVGKLVRWYESVDARMRLKVEVGWRHQ